MSRGLSRLALVALYPLRLLAHLEGARPRAGSPVAAMHIARATMAMTGTGRARGQSPV